MCLVVAVNLTLFPCTQIDHVRAERDVLAEVHNPYVVKLYYSFQVRPAFHTVENGLSLMVTKHAHNLTRHRGDAAM